LVYETRDSLLDGGELETKKIMQIAKTNMKEFFVKGRKNNLQDIQRYILDNISYRLDDSLIKLSIHDDEEVFRYLTGLVRRALAEQEEKLGNKELMGDFMRVATLRAVDEAWIEQVDYLQQLQYAVAGRSSAQRNPIYEYQKEALESFRKMEKTIRRNMVRNILLSDVFFDKEGELQILLP
jgi:preprotein translocase subunit SecA